MENEADRVPVISRTSSSDVTYNVEEIYKDGCAHIGYRRRRRRRATQRIPQQQQHATGFVVVYMFAR